MKRFILIIRENIENKRTEAELSALIALHSQWAKELAAQGIFESGEGIESNGVSLAWIDQQAHVLPIHDPQQAFGGFYIIQADSLAKATEIGKSCPTLAQGDLLEIRPLL
ncbi:MAG: YciI family protein [Chitinophagales bacterium]|jgi:hypothetical protein|nr:YciI family protein [Chitinophagales bacterium]